ncbi:unnamed protein product [Sphagnum troendelagicum]|uniref:Uncharacterized protein n=1 Tax=Sphagnum troendelagicum TaxID=128251 RepID=A0ABP0V1A1_9BRYO
MEPDPCPRQSRSTVRSCPLPSLSATFTELRRGSPERKTRVKRIKCTRQHWGTGESRSSHRYSYDDFPSDSFVAVRQLTVVVVAVNGARRKPGR